MFEYERQRGEGRERGEKDKKEGERERKRGGVRESRKERGLMYWRLKKIEMNLLCLTVIFFIILQKFRVKQIIL